MSSFTEQDHHDSCTGMVQRMWSQTAKYNWCAESVVSFKYLKDVDLYELIWFDTNGKKNIMHGESFQDATEKAMGWEVMTESNRLTGEPVGNSY